MFSWLRQCNYENVDSHCRNQEYFDKTYYKDKIYYEKKRYIMQKS